jgi:repressor LexA
VQPLTKRQREILDYLRDFIQQQGYAPVWRKSAVGSGSRSLATVHKHLTNLQEKGCIRRSWNRSRSVELLSARTGNRAVELPMLGFVAAGAPIEAVASDETIAVQQDLVGKKDSYVQACAAIRWWTSKSATATSSSSKIARPPTTARW